MKEKKSFFLWLFLFVLLTTYSVESHNKFNNFFPIKIIRVDGIKNSDDVNNITDRYHDWPLSTPQFLDMIDEKYDNVDAIHHYEITQSSGSDKVKIDIGTDNTDYPSATPITNYEFELERQNTISRIRLLDPAYISRFVEEFESLMKESIL